MRCTFVVWHARQVTEVAEFLAERDKLAADPKRPPQRVMFVPCIT
jgi:hypothetical protein